LKVLSELDIYSTVGANKALQLVDVRVSVGEDGAMVMKFEGVNGNPMVSGIGIKRAAKLPGIFTSSSLTCYIKPV
jgi:kinesin family protein C2/C3